MALNLEKQLLFYGAYHHDPINIAIHVACVPVLLLTGCMLASNSPNLELFPALSIPYFPINLGTGAATLYSILYVLMEPVAGILLAPIILGGTAYGNHLLDLYGKEANKYAIIIHVVCWVAQFIGHGQFEGRAPALLDNLVQAIFLAPLFVWLEVLFFFGYRPELKSRLDKAVDIEIKKFKESKSANGSSKKIQ